MNMKLINNKIYVNDILRSIAMNDLEEIENCKILITGGCGLIGSAIVDILTVLNLKFRKNIDIFVADLYIENFKRRFNHPNIKFIEYNSIYDIKFTESFDYIICAAGIANPNYYIMKPAETVLSNINGIENILEYSKNKKVKKVVYISSSEVYGKVSCSEPISEKIISNIDINNIRSAYSIGKIASEMLCKSYSKEYNVNTSIVRPGHVFGPTQSPTDTRISSDFSLKAACGQTLVMKSKGVQKRSYMYCVDCAMAILIVMLKGENGVAYNIANKDVITIYEMAKILAEIGNVELKLDLPNGFDVKKFNPMNNSALDSEKLYSIGYNNAFTAAEGLEHTIQILKEIL